jgi:hypothetical protein
MIKLANNGQNVDKLVDCSDTIPIPEFWNGPVALPHGKTLADLDHPVSYGTAEKYSSCLMTHPYIPVSWTATPCDLYPRTTAMRELQLIKTSHYAGL